MEVSGRSTCECPAQLVENKVYASWSHSTGYIIKESYKNIQGDIEEILWEGLLMHKYKLVPLPAAFFDAHVAILYSNL